MRIHTIVTTLFAVASFALAGCAGETGDQDPTTPENTQSTQQGNAVANRFATAAKDIDQGGIQAALPHSTVGEHFNQANGQDLINVVPSKTPTFGDDPARRMYDFSQTPRIGARAPYDVNLNELNNASIIVHGGQLVTDHDIALGRDGNCGVTCGAP